MLHSIWHRLTANVGTIALVILLAYVGYNEYLRRGPSGQTLTESITVAKQASADVRALRLEVQQARRAAERATVLNSGLLQQGQTLLDSIRLVTVAHDARRAPLERAETALRGRYDQQKKHIRAIQNQVK